jgi:hypothetical protein
MMALNAAAPSFGRGAACEGALAAGKAANELSGWLCKMLLVAGVLASGIAASLAAYPRVEMHRLGMGGRASTGQGCKHSGHSSSCDGM